MNNLARYIIITVVSAVILFIVWYFLNIISYILIAAVLSLIGKPVVDLLGKVHYKKFQIPKWVRALFVLSLIWALFILFFIIFIPLIAKEANTLSQVDINPILNQLSAPLEKINNLFLEINGSEGQYSSFQDYLVAKISSVMNVSLLSSILNTLTTFIGDFFIAIFSISFIMFFFLKDEKMFGNGLMLLVPSKHEEAVRNVLDSSRKLLMRYFIGIGLQMTGIMILITIGLSIVGLNFSRCVLIGLFMGIINIIPYVGPFIGAIFGLIIGSAGYIDLELTDFLFKMIWMIFVFLAVQSIDNLMFQPLIFGNSVNAHPLEIFLVIMVAGSVSGIPGMILAIPAYSVFRVFAREFLYKFKLIKKITEKIPVTDP